MSGNRAFCFSTCVTAKLLRNNNPQVNSSVLSYTVLNLNLSLKFHRAVTHFQSSGKTPSLFSTGLQFLPSSRKLRQIGKQP